MQTVRLPSRAQRPEITFAELIQPGVSEILVHHETTRDSGGAQQEDFVVLKMLHDRVAVVLDTTEKSEITLTNGTPSETDNLHTDADFDVFRAEVRAELSCTVPHPGKAGRDRQQDHYHSLSSSGPGTRNWSVSVRRRLTGETRGRATACEEAGRQASPGAETGETIAAAE